MAESHAALLITSEQRRKVHAMTRLGQFVADLREWRVEFSRPGESGLSGLSLWRAGHFALTLVIVSVNLIGFVAVLLVAIFVVPLPTVADQSHVRAINAIVAAGYITLAVPVGAYVGVRGMFGLRRWLTEERPASGPEQQTVLRAPLRLFLVQVALWFGAAILFGALNSAYNGLLGAQVALTVAITGVTTASCSYLLSERILRSAASRALAAGMPERLAVPGVATRAVLAWALGTGLPVIGLVMVGTLRLTGENHATPSQLAVAMVVLGGIGIVVGVLAVSLAARASADPLESVRRALARVQRGEFDVRVPVYDGTQIGQLQLGFNQMVSGLAERERIREMFGTYVDAEVAEHILQEGGILEGEEIEVTIMFIDIRDFTGFAERLTAREVVAAINRLFELIVPIIHAHEGTVDKFVGDGLLAVFGAPRRLGGHADQALAAAIEIDTRMHSVTHVELEIGIGLNSGVVIAGNVGAAGRLEFTVIGDAVNVASRVEAATRDTGDSVLVTESTRALLTDEPVPLVERVGVTLKGKRETVRLYAFE
jgi:adenylate cyclase